MVDSNVNYNFDLEVKGLKKRIKADPRVILVVWVIKPLRLKLSHLKACVVSDEKLSLGMKQPTIIPQDLDFNISQGEDAP